MGASGFCFLGKSPRLQMTSQFCPRSRKTQVLQQGKIFSSCDIFFISHFLADRDDETVGDDLSVRKTVFM